ncbi:hypothetical protein [Streptomyces sp. NPDC060198]|uniref:hypothetical protein n=1 Tax=Streptomyces sp. NPDC060198 TaxID=3347070 RepID=UPI00364CDE0F
MSDAYHPLFDPATDGDTWVPSLDMALELARDTLAMQATANIHDHNAMVRAAVALEDRLRTLVASLDKEAGR